MQSGFTLVDFTIPTRDHPMSHPPSQPPHCKECLSLDLCFFNPLCPGCQDILSDSKTTIPELFAVMRQWAPQTQRNMASLSREVLRRGANINDKDGLTDLSLLHYACKAGAVGLGNATSASNLVQSLISKGADTTMRCRWTDMNSMHYAVYFDAAENVRVLAEKNPSLVMSTCSELSNRTCLHLAAVNLSLQASKVLLRHGADGSLRDSDGKTPYDLIPENVPSEQANTRRELAELLKNAAENPPPKRAPSEESTSRAKCSQTRNPVPLILPTVHDTPKNSNLTLSHRPADPAIPKSPAPSNYSTISTTSTAHSPHTGSSSSSHSPSPEASGVTMASLGLRLGSKVVIDANSSKPKLGVIRFGGNTEFHPGQWAGIELDDKIGKNDGSYSGIRYFTCKAKHGLFVPMHRVSKYTKNPRQAEKKRKKKTRDSSDTTSLAIEAQSHLSMNSEMQIGDRVLISGNRLGVLRYAGAVKFAPGFWMGVELDMPTGKNDGSMNSIRYFKCPTRHGVFVLQSKVKKTSEPQHPAKCVPNGRTPVSSGAESTDYGSASGSVSLVTSGASGASEAETTSPPPLPSPIAPHKRLGANSSNSNSNSRSISSLLSRQSTRSGNSGVSTGKPSLDIALAEGMSVFVNKEMGVIKFIGRTEFSEGVWLGVELRKPVGRNDGSVQGERYFTCKHNHGLFVKPEKASHRGIKCSSILPNNY